MRIKLVTALVAAAVATAPLAAPPAGASEETHVCAIFADPYDAACALVMGVICRRPGPPLSICN